MKTIEQYIETEMSGKITRKKNSPLPSMLVLVIGVGLLLLLRTATVSDTLMATCLTLGIICTALGLILMAMSLTGAMSHFVYLPTRSGMHEKKVYVSTEDYSLVVDAIENNDQRSLALLRPVVSSNSALRILASRDGDCALLQAGRYDTGHFEPETEVCLLTGTSAIAIQHLVR